MVHFQAFEASQGDGTTMHSDHLIFTLPAIEGIVSDLFSILHRGYMPAALRDCILVPAPKGNKDPNSLDHYHPVALAHQPLVKALEGPSFLCILIT